MGIITVVVAGGMVILLQIPQASRVVLALAIPLAMILLLIRDGLVRTIGRRMAPKSMTLATVLALMTVWAGPMDCDAQGADAVDPVVESPELTEEIEMLVGQLDADAFGTRQSAVKRLIEIGAPALAALEKARKDPSPEVRLRANQVIDGIKRERSGAIDLKPVSNHKLNQMFGRLQGNTLDSLPRGAQELGGTAFTVSDGVLVLGSNMMPNRPKKIAGIKVARKCALLHVLQGSIFGRGGNAGEGDLIAKYIVHYEDKTREEIPVEYGVDVRDWWNDDDSKPVKHGKVAWEGDSPVAKEWGCTLRLYSGSWRNPHPDKMIATIDFVATHQIAAPFCVAMTMENATEEPKD